MTSNKHTHSIHIDAPVEKVFHYLEDPAHFVAGMPWESHGTHATGTTLTFTWDASTLMKMLDAAFYHSDKDADRTMATFKREVEALP